MPYLTVKALKRGTFEVDADGHSFVVDDGKAARGGGAGPSPLDLSVAGLASNVAATVDDVLARYDCPDSEFRVTAHYRLSSTQPCRISSVDLTVNLPELPADRVAEIKGSIRRRIAATEIPPSLEVGVVIVTGEPASTGQALDEDDGPLLDGTVGPIYGGPNGSR